MDYGTDSVCSVIVDTSDSVEEATNKNGTGFDIIYYPSKEKNKIYEKRYEKYYRFATFNEGLS